MGRYTSAIILGTFMLVSYGGPSQRISIFFPTHDPENTNTYFLLEYLQSGLCFKDPQLIMNCHSIIKYNTRIP